VPGMNSGLSPDDPTLVAAFRSALLHQSAIALLIVAFLWLLWATMRTWRLVTPGAKLGAGGTDGESAATVGTVGAGVTAGGKGGGGWEARGRAVLRVGFGMIWILDGILQAQPKMAGGLASQVIEPSAGASPGWVQHLVNWGGTIWSYHPITAGAASVWIQIGIGVWLLVAKNGPWSRLAGLASVAWGLVVWAFGEAFGGIFAPGLSWLTGAPGGVLVYVVAGALIALPENAWRSPRLGRLLLGGIGLFFIGMAVLQAWPGRGYWKGVINGQPGTLAGMVQSMSSTPQPHFLSALVADFGSFAASNGFAVNLVVVLALAAMGAVFVAGFATGRPRLVRYAVWFGGVFCLAVWVLVQDLGFLGGLGTDPNSMIPFILLFSAGYLALTPAAREAPAVVAASAGGESAAGDEQGRGGRERLRRPAPKAVGTAVATASLRSVGAVAALGIILLGAAPMAAAATNRTADPILALAIEGDSSAMDIPAYGFQLTDQSGQPVSLASLRGKVVVMTFLDPVCTTDCPVIGAELKETGVLLGAADKDVELVAIVANPIYRSAEFTQAFDREEGLAAVPNWLFLTGSVSELDQVWKHYGVAVLNLPAGAMVDHSDVAMIIDRTGHIREVVGADPGPATDSTQSSWSVLLTQYTHQVLSDS
jgi:cytochrome oxidase Cu insertion factor (SCO1/SenC/PrrC family)